MATTTKIDAGKLRFLATGLAGSLLVNLSAQFISVNAADIQGGVFASADEASWISTVYTMAGFAGIAVSVVLIRTLGIGRYLVVSSLVFGGTALACATAPDLSVMIALRAVQGFVAGGFGPAAFVAVFMTASGPLLTLVLAVFASVLLMPGTLGPIVSALVEGSFGWQALFLVQTAIGAALALAAHAWAPRPKPDWSALKTGWVAIFLLSASLAAAALVFGQGTRRFWFESEMIVWCTAASIGAMAGYIFIARFSPSPRLASRSDAGGPITTSYDHTRSSDGRRPPSSPSPVTRAGIWRCAVPRAPRQLPSLPPPNRANPTARANSGFDKTWGQGHQGRRFGISQQAHHQSRERFNLLGIEGDGTSALGRCLAQRRLSLFALGRRSASDDNSAVRRSRSNTVLSRRRLLGRRTDASGSSCPGTRLPFMAFRREPQQATLRPSLFPPLDYSLPNRGTMKSSWNASPDPAQSLG